MMHITVTPGWSQAWQNWVKTCKQDTKTMNKYKRPLELNGLDLQCKLAKFETKISNVHLFYLINFIIVVVDVLQMLKTFAGPCHV